MRSPATLQALGLLACGVVTPAEFTLSLFSCKELVDVEKVADSKRLCELNWFSRFRFFFSVFLVACKSLM